MYRVLALVALGVGTAPAFSVSPMSRVRKESHSRLSVSIATPWSGRSRASSSEPKYRDMDDLVVEDKEGGPPVRIRVRDVKREWADGSFNVDLILPGDKDDEEVKGAALFVHGFSQYPKAYTKTLKEIANEAGVAVVAVETGTTSKIVLKGVARGEGNAQFVLQRAVSKDTIQCINMVLNGEEPFSEHIKKKVPLGLIGHSMGGGLCFDVATKFSKKIKYVAAMAPYPGEPAFDPFNATARYAPEHSMLMAGSWDVIARSSVVKRLSAAGNKEKKKSSLFVEIARGLHTGFQDDITLFNIKLTGLPVTFILWQIFGFLDILVIRVLQLFRTNTGQLDVSHFLLSWFFTKMVNGEKVTQEDANKALENDPDMKKKWLDKVTISYGDD